MAKRSYSQYCALARTLDLLGERWTLLIVRDLVVGPKRYSDLLASLPGIGTSLLAARLNRLETAHVIQRRELPPPAASTVYELTGVGRELAEALHPLARWGARHMLGRRRRGEVFRAEWPLLVLGGALDPARITGARASYEFHIDESIAHLRVENGEVGVHPGPDPTGADIVITLDLDTFVGVGTGRVDFGAAVSSGKIAMLGESGAMQEFVRLLPVAAKLLPVAASK
jgi:DNA-binding HxlR family transcriptional regulator